MSFGPTFQSAPSQRTAVIVDYLKARLTQAQFPRKMAGRSLISAMNAEVGMELEVTVSSSPYKKSQTTAKNRTTDAGQRVRFPLLYH